MKRELYQLELFCDNDPQEHETINMHSYHSMAMCVSGCRHQGWAVGSAGALCPACSGKARGNEISCYVEE